jgi:hypothetical protein
VVLQEQKAHFIFETDTLLPSPKLTRMRASNNKKAKGAKPLKRTATKKTTKKAAKPKPVKKATPKQPPKKAPEALPAELPPHITIEFLKTNYITEAQAMEILGYGRTKMYYLRRDGKLGFKKEGRQVMHSLADIARFRENGTGGRV